MYCILFLFLLCSIESNTHKTVIQLPKWSADEREVILRSEQEFLRTHSISSHEVMIWNWNLNESTHQFEFSNYSLPTHGTIQVLLQNWKEILFRKLVPNSKIEFRVCNPAHEPYVFDLHWNPSTPYLLTISISKESISYLSSIQSDFHLDNVQLIADEFVLYNTIPASIVPFAMTVLLVFAICCLWVHFL